MHPHFDLGRYWATQEQQLHLDTLHLKAMKNRRKPIDIEQENLFFLSLSPEDQQAYRRLQFARWMVQQGKLTEFPSLPHFEGVDTLHQLAQEAGESPASWSVSSSSVIP